MREQEKLRQEYGGAAENRDKKTSGAFELSNQTNRKTKTIISIIILIL